MKLNKVNKILLIIFLITTVFLVYQSRQSKFIKTKDPNVKDTTNIRLNSVVPCKDCNLIIISVDPLRARSMNMYGYSKKTTPNIDRLSDVSLVFYNSVSVSSWTLPSHMSLLTGVYPSRHKITNKIGLAKDGKEFENNLQKVSPGIITLAEVLKDNGYDTAGFTGGAADASEFGFDKGFDLYVDDGDFAGLDPHMSKAIDWINSQKGKKFFMFMQGYDVHGQFVPEKGYDRKFLDSPYKGNLTGSKEEQKDFREQGITRGSIFLTSDDVRFLTGIYDEKVFKMDEKIGRFIETLKQSGIWNNTIIVFTSGHGEELYEHGRIDHGHSLYEELIDVPLIIRIPGIDKKILSGEQVSTVDIFPTMLDLLGLGEMKSKNQKLEGKSIVELLQNGDNNSDVFLETDYRYSVFKRGLRSGDGWKLIRDLETGETELFDVNNDKNEKNNLSEKNSGKLKEMNGKLDSFLNKF